MEDILYSNNKWVPLTLNTKQCFVDIMNVNFNGDEKVYRN